VTLRLRATSASFVTTQWKPYDALDQTATVKLVANWGIDYMLLVKAEEMSGSSWI